MMTIIPVITIFVKITICNCGKKRQNEGKQGWKHEMLWCVVVVLWCVAITTAPPTNNSTLPLRNTNTLVRIVCTAPRIGNLFSCFSHCRHSINVFDCATTPSTQTMGFQNNTPTCIPPQAPNTPSALLRNTPH
jgi:hypothetical protein